MLNGHNSHLNIRFLDWCTKHRILVCAYPSHLTHRLQPLDVSLFGPLTQYYLLELDDYIHKSFRRRGMSKKEFFGLFWLAFERAFTEKNIKSGWAKQEFGHVTRVRSQTKLRYNNQDQGLVQPA